MWFLIFADSSCILSNLREINSLLPDFILANFTKTESCVILCFQSMKPCCSKSLTRLSNSDIAIRRLFVAVYIKKLAMFPQFLIKTQIPAQHFTVYELLKLWSLLYRNRNVTLQTRHQTPKKQRFQPKSIRQFRQTRLRTAKKLRRLLYLLRPKKTSMQCLR